VRWTVLGMLAACGSADEQPPPDPAPTADTAAATTTGSRDETGRDTAGPPATADTGAASTWQPAVGTVEVRLSADRQAPDARLLVSNLDGSFVRAESTTAGTLVLSDVPVGGTITEVVETRQGVRLTTLADIADGDVLHFPGHASHPEPVLGTYTLEVPQAPAVPFVIWELEASCFVTANQPLPFTTTVELRPACHAGSEVAVFARALSATLEPVAIATGASALGGAPPALSGSVTLGAWQTDETAHVGRYTHRGPDVRIEVRANARRNGRTLPQGLPLFTTVSDGEVAQARTGVDPGFHDEVQIRYVRSPAAGGPATELLVSDRALPAAGATATVTVDELEFPPAPDRWSFDAEAMTVSTPMPFGWRCRDRPPRVLQIDLTYLVAGLANPVRWRWVGRYEPFVALPDLEPTDAPRPDGGFATVEVRVHGGEVDIDALRQRPELTGSPEAWLSGSGPGRICSHRATL